MEHNITGIFIKEVAPTAVRKAILMTAEQAKSLYKKDKSFRDTLLSEFTDGELGIKPKMKAWEDLEYVTGYWVGDNVSVIHENFNLLTIEAHKGIYATEKQALSAFAMAQLSQLMKDLGDECDVDWDNKVEKFVIGRQFRESFYKKSVIHIYYFLAFKTESVRDAFLEKHEDLIKQYFMV